MELIFLELTAFNIIKEAIEAELLKQDFSGAKDYQDDNGKAVAFFTEHAAYSLIYDETKSSFVLRSATVTDGEPNEWKNLSQWLFDLSEGTKADAQTIANDFCEVIEGPKRIAAIQNMKKKKKKDEEGNIDPQFLFNRFANVFPELKDKMNEDRITYGQVRFAVLAKSYIAPTCEETALKSPNSEEFKKMVNIFNDMYKDGDIQVRAILTHGIFNSINDQAMEKISPLFSEELAKIYKCSRKLKDKKIKPEKVKKQKKVVAAALDNANKNHR